MQFFLDSANIKEIEKFNNYGILDGVTTNPSLIAKTIAGATPGSISDNSSYPGNLSLTDKFGMLIKELCGAVKGDVSIEVPATDYEQMISQGDKILNIASSNNIVIKLPVTWEGIKACKYFSRKGQKVNMTLCFTATQALLAARAGATYISPFIGRLDDTGTRGIDLINTIRNIYNNGNIKTRILAASIRNIEHIVDVALNGADVLTLPPSIMVQLLDHHLTTTGLAKFEQDWQETGIQI